MARPGARIPARRASAQVPPPSPSLARWHGRRYSGSAPAARPREARRGEHEESSWPSDRRDTAPFRAGHAAGRAAGGGAAFTAAEGGGGLRSHHEVRDALRGGFARALREVRPRRRGAERALRHRGDRLSHPGKGRRRGHRHRGLDLERLGQGHGHADHRPGRAGAGQGQPDQAAGPQGPGRFRQGEKGGGPQGDASRHGRRSRQRRRVPRGQGAGARLAHDPRRPGAEHQQRRHDRRLCQQVARRRHPRIALRRPGDRHGQRRVARGGPHARRDDRGLCVLRQAAQGAARGRKALRSRPDGSIAPDAGRRLPRGRKRQGLPGPRQCHRAVDPHGQTP